MNPEIPEELEETTQLKVAPATPDVKVTADEVEPEQIVCDIGLFVIVGVGFTVTVSVKVLPTQLPDVPDVGVTV